MAKAQTTSENPQGEVSQQDTPVLPMQYDVRIHSIQFDGPCRATASLNINGCFAVRGVKLMEGNQGHLFSVHTGGTRRTGIGCRDRLPAGTDAGDEPLSPVRAGPHGTAGSEDGYVTH